MTYEPSVDILINTVLRKKGENTYNTDNKIDRRTTAVPFSDKNCTTRQEKRFALLTQHGCELLPDTSKLKVLDKKTAMDGPPVPTACIMNGVILKTKKSIQEITLLFSGLFTAVKKLHKKETYALTVANQEKIANFFSIFLKKNSDIIIKAISVQTCVAGVSVSSGAKNLFKTAIESDRLADWPEYFNGFSPACRAEFLKHGVSEVSHMYELPSFLFKLDDNNDSDSDSENATEEEPSLNLDFVMRIAQHELNEKLSKMKFYSVPMNTQWKKYRDFLTSAVVLMERQKANKSVLTIARSWNSKTQQVVSVTYNGTFTDNQCRSLVELHTPSHVPVHLLDVENTFEEHHDVRYALGRHTSTKPMLFAEISDAAEADSAGVDAPQLSCDLTPKLLSDYNNTFKFANVYCDENPLVLKMVEKKCTTGGGWFFCNKARFIQLKSNLRVQKHLKRKKAPPDIVTIEAKKIKK